MSALEQDGTTLTFKLRDDYDSVWITVGEISVYVRRTEDGARVQLFAQGDEDADPPLDVAQAVAPSPEICECGHSRKSHVWGRVYDTEACYARFGDGKYCPCEVYKAEGRTV